MTDRFVPDCGHCAALCCIAFAFDRSEDFGHDKPADCACFHLETGYRCAIHHDLGSEGYPGCVRFDCLGAGQRVTQEVFDGGDWQAEPALIAPMSAAFRTMRRIHEFLCLLESARTLALASAAELERRLLVSALEPGGGWSTASLAEFEHSRLGDDIQTFLRSLAAHTGAA